MSCSLGGHWAFSMWLISSSLFFQIKVILLLLWFSPVHISLSVFVPCGSFKCNYASVLFFLMKMWCYGLLAGCKRAYLVPCYNSSIIYYHLQRLFLLDQTALNVSIVMLSLLDVNFTQIYHINLFIIRTVLLLCGSGKAWGQHNYTDHRAWKWNFI